MTTQAMMEPGEPGKPFDWFSKNQPTREEQPLTRLAVDTEVCDARCPAPAVFRVDKPSAGCLLFCGHHYDENEPALAAGGWALSQLRARPA